MDIEIFTDKERKQIYNYGKQFFISSSAWIVTSIYSEIQIGLLVVIHFV